MSFVRSRGIGRKRFFDSEPIIIDLFIDLSIVLIRFGFVIDSDGVVIRDSFWRWPRFEVRTKRSESLLILEIQRVVSVYSVRSKVLLNASHSKPLLFLFKQYSRCQLGP